MRKASEDLVENVTSSAAPLARMTSKLSGDNRNFSHEVSDGVRGKLSEVERMLQQVKYDVIDRVKRESPEGERLEGKRLQGTTSLPSKHLRFQDEGPRKLHSYGGMTRNNNNNGSGSGPRWGPLAGRGLGYEGGKESAFKNQSGMGNKMMGRSSNGGRQKEKMVAVKKDRELEEEFKRLEVIKKGVADLKRRHTSQTLTLRETQEKLRLALEKLQDR